MLVRSPSPGVERDQTPRIGADRIMAEAGLRPTGAGSRTASAGGRRRRWARAARLLGWALILLGAAILLYLAYLLFWTGIETSRAQAQLLEDWELEVGPVEPAPLAGRSRPPDEIGTPEAPGAAELGDAVAAMWFERPGSDQRPAQASTLLVVEGVGVEDLKRGPGHYPDTAAPGDPGNFALAGHRTTYGAPFYDLDELRRGDEIHVVDRAGREWVYIVERSEVVQPSETWVIGDDPLGTGRPTLTLTTCTPRFSAAQRLIVFAQLDR